MLTKGSTAIDAGTCPRRRDGRGRRRRARVDSPAGGAFAVRVAVECEHADCNDQQGSDHHVQLARGRVSDGLVAIDLVLAFQSFRGQLVHPGEDQREWKAEHQKPEHEARCPVGQLQDVKEKLADLQDHPAGDQVQERNAEDVAPLQLGDQRHRGVLVPIVAARMHGTGLKSIRTHGASSDGCA